MASRWRKLEKRHKTGTIAFCYITPQSRGARGEVMLSLWVLVLLLAQATPPVTSQQQLIPNNIFVLAGQSNMAGRGGVTKDPKDGNITWDGVVPAQCQPNPSILRLSAGLTWVQAHEPLHADIDYNKTNGIGPGMAFANALLTNDQTISVVGLVPCAIGGTRMTQWAKGGFLYDQLVKRAQVALQSGGAIRAMLWYQGETDTINREDALAYKGRLEKFFTDLRSDLLHPSLPIFQVALASGEGPYVEAVREAQLGVQLSNVQCVDAKGLPLGKDGLHLTTPAQVQLGHMLANAFLQPATPIHTTNINASGKMSSLLSHNTISGLILGFFLILF